MPDLNKLGLTKFNNVRVTGAPDDMRLMLQNLPSSPDAKVPCDLQVSFVFSLEEMKQVIADVATAQRISPHGTLCVVYPKLASKRYVGIHRDDIFPFIHVNDDTGEVGTTGLKFSRMRSFDENFTVLDLRWLAQVPRRKTRSQRASDYQARLPELAAELPVAARSQWDTLTPGYQREWARYIYSPATAKTRAVHLAQAITALVAGFGNIEQYKASLKS